MTDIEGDTPSHGQEAVLEKINELIPEREDMPSWRFTNPELAEVFGGEVFLKLVSDIHPRLSSISSEEISIAATKAALGLIKEKGNELEVEDAKAREKLIRDWEEENLSSDARYIVNGLVQYFVLSVSSKSTDESDMPEGGGVLVGHYRGPSTPLVMHYPGQFSILGSSSTGKELGFGDERVRPEENSDERTKTPDS
jgi:hypothetical protein